MVPPLPERSRPSVQLTVPLLIRTRPLKSWSAPVAIESVLPAEIVVLPEEFQVPAFQVRVLLPVKLCVPASAPPVWRNPATLTLPETAKVPPASW